MPRPVMVAGLLGAAVGVPYVVEHSDQLQAQFKSSPPAATETHASTVPPPLTGIPTMPVLESPGDHLYRSTAPLEGIPAYSMADVLRMDVSKEWVYSRWARKSTGLAEPELFGVRVPLVSGTRMSDVAGSLTYYFNVAGQVDKIRLTGKTANPSELVGLLQRRYGLQPAIPLVPGEQVYRLVRDGRVESELKTRTESVLWATSPHSSFSVELEINRPGSGRFVKPPMPQLKGIDNPPQPAPLLPGQTPTQPPGQPVFPGESVVPSSDTASDEQSSGESSAEEPSPVKKQPKSHLRWPT